MVEDVIGVNLTAIAVVVKHIPCDVIGIGDCFLFPRELYIVLGRSFTVVGTDRPALCENLVQSHRLEIPVHTTHIVNLISASDAVQIRGVVYLEVRFIREVGVCVKVDCLMAMAVVHGDEVMGKNDSFLRAVFQGHTDIVIVLYARQCFLGFRIV